MGEFKDFIFRSIEAISATYREVVSEVVAKQTHDGIVARDVATALLKLLFNIVKCESACIRQFAYSIIRCSSPESPQKLLAILKDHVSTMSSTVEKGVDVAQENLDKSRTSQLFLAVGDVGALVTVITELFTACSSSTDDVNSCARTITDLSAKALLGSLLRLHDAGAVSATSSLDKLCTSAPMNTSLTSAYLFCHDTIGCMSLMSRQILMERSSDDRNEELSLAIFIAFLEAVEMKWPSLELSAKLCVFKVIKEFYRRNEFESCISESRSKLEGFLSRLKGQEAAADISENVVELLQFISA